MQQLIRSFFQVGSELKWLIGSWSKFVSFIFLSKLVKLTDCNNPLIRPGSLHVTSMFLNAAMNQLNPLPYDNCDTHLANHSHRQASMRASAKMFEEHQCRLNP